MYKTIVFKEIRENLLSYKFTVVTLLSTALVLTSLFVMFNDYVLRMENHEILRPEAGDPTALVAPTPLSIFARGLDENLCRSYRIRFAGMIEVGSKQQSVNTLFRLFTTPDMLYIVKVILALCALLFSFDRITGEKTSGTLSLTLSGPLKRTTLILGKWTGSFVSLIVPFTFAFFLGAAILQLSPHVLFDSGDWTRLLLFYLISVFYISVFLSLGFLISSVTSNSASSLVVSLFVWTLLVFMIPNLGNTLARQMVTLPSVQRLELEREHIWIREIFDRVHGKKEWSEATGNIYSENDKLIADYRNRFGRLVRLSQNITRLSPAAAYTAIATDLACTGIAEEERVKRAVLEYRNLVWRSDSDSDGNLTGDIPAFTYQRSTVRDILTFQWFMNLLIVLLFNALFLTAAYGSFMRYDVRWSAAS